MTEGNERKLKTLQGSCNGIPNSHALPTGPTGLSDSVEGHILKDPTVTKIFAYLNIT